MNKEDLKRYAKKIDKITSISELEEYADIINHNYLISTAGRNAVYGMIILKSEQIKNE